MMGIAYHADLNDVQCDARLAALADSPEARAPFDRLVWWRGLARDCGLAPWIAVARDGSGIAMLPLMRAPRRIEALANWYSFRWRPLLSQGADGLGLLTALARDLAKQTGRVTLAPVPDEEGEASLLARAFRAAGWAVEWKACDINHVLEVAGRGFPAYLAGRPGPLRTTLARKAHRVDIALSCRFDPAAWDDYEAVYAASWKPAEGSPQFLRHFAQSEGAAGRLRLGLARIEGRAVAAQFWTVENGTAFIHKLAHDEAAKALSPGTALTAALIEHVIERDGVERIDFGTGDEPYKRDWMESVRPRYRLDMFRPGRPRNWPHIVRAGFRRLAAGPSHD